MISAHYGSAQNGVHLKYPYEFHFRNSRTVNHRGKVLFAEADVFIKCQDIPGIMTPVKTLTTPTYQGYFDLHCRYNQRYIDFQYQNEAHCCSRHRIRHWHLLPRGSPREPPREPPGHDKPRLNYHCATYYACNVSKDGDAVQKSRLKLTRRRTSVGTISRPTTTTRRTNTTVVAAGPNPVAPGIGLAALMALGALV